MGKPSYPTGVVCVQSGIGQGSLARGRYWHGSDGITSRNILPWLLLDADGFVIRTRRNEPTMGGGAGNHSSGRKNLAVWSVSKPQFGFRVDCLGRVAGCRRVKR
jgi:hypothetical protein